MWRGEADLPSPLGTETNPAIRDSAGEARDDGSGTQWGWQDSVYPRADESYEHVRQLH